MDARLLKVTDVSRVEIRELRILPGHAAGPHVHNGPVVGSILAGSAVFQIEGQPESVLRPGDVFFEPEDEGVTFLGYFLLSPGQDASITMLDQ
jgi:quercetin dioxygenase-like cupin family protein